MSEQTIYTIANDIAEFKEYQPGELITEQDLKSPYNLNNLLNEVTANQALCKTLKTNKQLRDIDPSLE